MANTGQVAVIMTCYNEGRYIGEAVRSVLDQTAQEAIAEIVIADDGSQEDTRHVLRDIETWDPRIKVLYGEGGTGLSGQRNLAIATTGARFLAILDGDDIWAHRKLEMQLATISRHKDVGLVYGDFCQFHDFDIEGGRRVSVRDITGASNLLERYFVCDPPIVPSTILVRREHLERCGGFDPAVAVFEDTDFFLRMATVCRFAVIGEVLLYKRGRATSITGGRSDLMAHHALVAFRACARHPNLLRLVARRLSDRARKLANQSFLSGGATPFATGHAQLAFRMRPADVRTWGTLLLCFLPEPLAKMLRGTLFRRRIRAIRGGEGA